MSMQEDADEAIAAVSDPDDGDEHVKPTPPLVESTQQPVDEAIERLDRTSSRDDACESPERAQLD